jgi:hypothetical protein
VDVMSGIRTVIVEADLGQANLRQAKTGKKT